MRPQNPLSPLFDSQRRRFLKTGIAGSALLLAGRWLAPAYAVDPTKTAFPFKNMSAADAGMLSRVIPVVLAGALPTDEAQRKAAIGEVIYGIDVTIGYQAPSMRKEVADMFGLLTNSATRALTAGVWKSWDKTTDADVEKFLNGWRNSRLSLLQSAYIGLHNLIIGSWYSNPRSWVHAGYGGPPKIA